MPEIFVPRVQIFLYHGYKYFCTNLKWVGIGRGRGGPNIFVPQMGGGDRAGHAWGRYICTTGTNICTTGSNICTTGTNICTTGTNKWAGERAGGGGGNRKRNMVVIVEGNSNLLT